LIADGTSGRIFRAGEQGELEKALLHVSATESLQGFKQRSRAGLDEWRKQTNPVSEIRRALADVGVLNSK
jgi:hypothetical protein